VLALSGWLQNSVHKQGVSITGGVSVHVSRVTGVDWLEVEGERLEEATKKEDELIDEETWRFSFNSQSNPVDSLRVMSSN